jgi:hypothetical protein
MLGTIQVLGLELIGKTAGQLAIKLSRLEKMHNFT